ncbi:aminotransferase class V-fold PLP-dependent enzyme [Maribacter sp. 2307ULW6-5]|uniref:aminotransferase class V-fold PLP-dependent enzyme n=1 Tax=Maribacter sp. 2307ULW6-5 TaxID=3386275 RepID=UPI0039BC9779
MNSIRDEFPVMDKGIYANTPVFGPLYKPLLKWRRQHDENTMQYGSAAGERNTALLSQTRQGVADFFGAETGDVALVPNFSTAMNLLLEGLRPKTKVLLLREDYPSLNWPFEHRDFEVHYLDLAPHLEARMEGEIGERNIEVLAVSMVQWLHGYRFRSGFFKELKDLYPALTILVDGTQFCGTMAFNFKDSGIDVFGASAYKWLLAGHGNGFMLFSEAAKERFLPKTIGFNSANGELDRKGHVPFAKRMEPGHLCPLSFGSLGFSLKFLSQLGIHNIAGHHRELSKKGLASFGSLGLLDHTFWEEENQSTIFNIKANDRVFHALAKNGVVCAKRGNGIRLGFHFFNGEAEIDAIGRILQRVL